MSNLKKPKKGKAAWRRWANRLRMQAKHPPTEKMIPVEGGVVPLAQKQQETPAVSSLDMLNEL